MTQRSRNRTVREGPEIQDGATESPKRYPLCKCMRVRQVPGPGHKAPGRLVILGGKRNHGGAK